MVVKQSEWKLVPIEEVYLGLYDGPHATPKPTSEGPIFLGIKNITEDGKLDLSEIRHIAEEDFSNWTKRVQPLPGDIVFTYEATLNRYAMIPEGFRGCLGRRLALIRPNFKRINTKFLFYYFFSEEWRDTIANNIMSGSTVDRIPIISFPKFKVRVPPLPVQRTIASILSAYDDLIENNTRRIAILEEMAQMIYEEWFVKFRFPGCEEVKMVESDLGRIPEGWEFARLGDIALELRRSINPESVDPETPYFGLEHLPRKSIALADWGEAKTVQSTKLIFKKGEILFGKIRPYLHKVGFAPLDGICSSDTIVIGSIQSRYKSLLLSCVSSDNFVAFASKTSQGTQMPRANWNVLATFPIMIPPPKLLSLFNNFVESATDSIINIIFRNQNLIRTRDLILPKLISGEIDVSSWVQGDAQELAASAVGTKNGYELHTEIRKVAEVGQIEPMEKDTLEWHSLWE